MIQIQIDLSENGLSVDASIYYDSQNNTSELERRYADSITKGIQLIIEETSKQDNCSYTCVGFEDPDEDMAFRIKKRMGFGK